MRTIILLAALWAVTATAQPVGPDRLLDAFDYVESGDFADTRAALYSKAQGGDVRAQYWLGRLLHDILPMPQRDYDQGRAWLARAAEGGHVGAAEMLGRIHEFGFIITADKVKAADYYERATALGSVTAPHDLARIEFTRDPRDDAKILRLLNIAAQRGHRNAMIDLGFTYASGALGEVDGVKARHWAERGIELRDPRAMNLMARLFASGLGVSRPDGIEALKWAVLAREFGNPEAEQLVKDIAAQLEEPQHEEARARAMAWRDGSR